MTSLSIALVAALAGCSPDAGVAEGEGPGPMQTRDGSMSTTDAATADSVTPVDVASTPAIVCLVDADCQTTNPCRTSRCELDGEIGACIYDPVADGTACAIDGCAGTCSAGECGGTTCGGTDRDAGTPDRPRDAGTTTDSGTPDTDGGTPETPVDPVCEATCPFDRLASVFPPFVALRPDDVPATCHNGFQLGGASGGCGVSVYTIHSTRPGGARDITLDVDFATYLVPDGVTVTGVDATGATYTLMATCRLQTYDHAGPSTMRPLDATIRQFRLHLRPGTTQLTFDFGPVTSPMYMRVVGLCDFDVTPFMHAAWWEAVP